VVLDLVHDALVLERAAVVREVDLLRRVGQQLHFAPRVVVALLEGLEGCGRLALQAEGGADFGPVDFECGAALWGWGGMLAEGGGRGRWGRRDED